MSKQIGVGVISLGWMGRLHARSYRALAERYQGLEADVQLVAACDPVEAARDEAVAALGFERAYADYRELLADPDVRCGEHLLPNFLHHEIALAAIAAGKPFWIEKPMGVSAAQSREIAERGGRRADHGRRLQLPAHPRHRARPAAHPRRPDRARHQRAVLADRRLRVVAGGAADLAAQPRQGRIRRHWRPPQPRRRPGAVPRRPHRGRHRDVGAVHPRAPHPHQSRHRTHRLGGLRRARRRRERRLGGGPGAS